MFSSPLFVKSVFKGNGEKMMMDTKTDNLKGEFVP